MTSDNEPRESVDQAEESDAPWVLITGIGGLIGTNVANELHPGYRVVGIDRREEDNLPHPNTPYEYYPVDLTDDANMDQTMEKIKRLSGGRLASVIHLAAYYDFSGEDSPLYQSLTVEGTRRLLRELQEFESVGQFVFSSSMLMMEPNNTPGTIDETGPVAGTWPYPASKIAAEKVIEEEHKEIPAVSLRIAGVYNERGRSLPLGQQIDRIYQKKFEGRFYPGDSQHGQALIHLEDLARCFRQVVDHRASLDPYEIFLVAEPDVMSYGQLQDRLGELINGNGQTTFRVPKVAAKVGAYAMNAMASKDDPMFIKPWMMDIADDHYQPDITKARTKLDWEPKHRLHDTLPAIIENLKADPERFYSENYLGNVES